MRQWSRRECFSQLGKAALAGGVLSQPGLAWAAPRQPSLTKEEWIARWMESASGKDVVGALYLGRFLDRMWFVAKPIAWRPSPAQAGRYQSVEVPVGFVTDLASVPRVFWQFLPTDGEYAFAAIIHDYLYWTQDRSREDSDEILNLGMEDLGVGVVAKNAIYRSVRLRGQSAWNANRKLKMGGECRILTKYPETPTVRWTDWKKRPDICRR
jgi:Protein of unknown function (DUF1353)